MMKHLAKTCAAACALSAAGGFTAAASARPADTDPPAAIEISGNVGLVSDYRFRGVSLSDRDPAIQGGIDIAHESGFFAGTWASSIADYGGSHVELDFYGGYGGAAAGIDYSLTVLGYVYPGGHGVGYYELKGSVGKTVGPASLQLEASWVPDQDNFPGDNVYVSAGVEVGVPDTAVTLHARGGRESDTFLRKWDWEAGASYSFSGLTATLAYIDSDYGAADEAGRLGRATLWATLLAEF